MSADNGSIKIEKGVPIPEKRLRGRPNKYPFREMAVGDSFAVPLNGEKAQRVQTTVTVAALNATRHGRGEFTTRVMGDVVRCWRVK